jgi:hypothetical protein
MLGQGMSLTNLREENSSGNIFTSLIEILKKELAVYSELKNTIICEKKIITKPTLDELNHNNALKENIILKARMLEEARINILKKIARNLDISTESIKLTQLAGYAGPEQSAEIEKIRDDLVLISREINALNAVNKDLLDASMGNIKCSLDFMTSIMCSESVYLKCGKMNAAHHNGKILHKEG